MEIVKAVYMQEQYVKLAINIVLMTFALASDIRTYKIKNRLVSIFIVIGIAINVVLKGKEGIGFSLIGMVVPIVVLFLLYYLKMLGAGDIKLFAAIGAIMGVKFILYAMVYSFLAGGMIALFIMLVRKNALQRFKYFTHYIKACMLSISLLPYNEFEDKANNGKFPFAYAIFCGTVYVFVVV